MTAERGRYFPFMRAFFSLRPSGALASNTATVAFRCCDDLPGLHPPGGSALQQSAGAPTERERSRPAHQGVKNTARKPASHEAVAAAEVKAVTFAILHYNLLSR